VDNIDYITDIIANLEKNRISNIINIDKIYNSKIIEEKIEVLKLFTQDILNNGLKFNV